VAVGTDAVTIVLTAGTPDPAAFGHVSSPVDGRAARGAR
jgi:hypothetical protein